MKLRRLPEDFQVEELSHWVNPPSGPRAGLGDSGHESARPRAAHQNFNGSLYRLTKTGLTTPDAVDVILRQWKLQRNRLSYGGMKDRHAVTTQYLTIRGGPARDLKTGRLTLEYLGRADREFSPADIVANRFRLTVRDLSTEVCERAETQLANVRTGIPNYFDDQRFGSLTAEGQFIAEPWIRGDYQRALWLMLADPYAFDSREEKEQKQILRDNWGEWLVCKQKLARSNRRSIITYLCDKPADFRGAWTRTRVDLRSIYLAAFQSHLWNRLTAAWLEKCIPAADLFPVALKPGPVPFFRRWDEAELASETIPLPSARMHLEPGPMQEFVDETLANLGWTLREIKVKSPRDSFFSKGWRSPVVVPRELTGSSEVDDLYPRRRKLHLEFSLPRGSYATMLIKRLFAGSPEAEQAILEEATTPEADEE